MSDLGGLHIVPALLALTLILVGVALVAGLCAFALNEAWRDDGLGYPVLFALTVLSAVAALVLLITSGCVSQKHSNDHCHALGGVLDSGGDHDCVKPNSFINA